MERILFYQPGGIGDCLFSLPLLNAVRGKWPQSVMDILLAEKSAMEFLKSQFSFHSYIHASGFLSQIAAVPRLAKTRYSLFIVPTAVNPAKACLGVLAAVPERVGEDINGKGYFYSIKVKPDHNKHAIDCNMDIAGALGLEKTVRYPLLTLDPIIESQIVQKLGLPVGQGWIGIHPGSQSGLAFKRWDKSRFAEIIKRVHNSGFRVLIFGGKEEVSLAETIAKESGVGPFVAAGKTTLMETMCLIKKCRLLVSNDSSLAHIADGLEVPVAAIFGPTDPVRYGPYHKRNKIITSPLDCSPCYSKRQIQCSELTCLKNITIETVWDVVREMLSKKDNV
jgi:lipopolysaccharide heptosyltransferase II